MTKDSSRVIQESWQPGGPTRDETTRSPLLVVHRHLLKIILLFILCRRVFFGLHICLFVRCVPYTKALDPLELELETILSCHVGSGDQMWALWKNGPCCEQLSHLSVPLLVSHGILSSRVVLSWRRAHRAEDVMETYLQVRSWSHASSSGPACCLPPLSCSSLPVGLRK